MSGPSNRTGDWRLYNETGSRNVAAERQLDHLHELERKAEDMALELAEKTMMLEKVAYVPSSNAEASELHQEAQRMAAGMAVEVVQTLRTIMLTSKRPTAQLDAAKALFEIGGRIRGGDGKPGTLPGSNVIIIDRADLHKELDKRKSAGSL